MEQIAFFMMLFIIGFVASFVGSFISGSTTLIGIGSMISLGVSPYIAIATQTAGVFGWGIGGIRQFTKAKKIAWRLVVPLACIGITGSIIGAKILITINEHYIDEIVGVIILLFIPLTLLNKKLGIMTLEKSKKKEYFGYLFYLLVSIWAGCFSAGAGMFFLFVYMYFFNLTILEAKGTDKIPGMVLSIGSIVIYYTHGFFQLSYVIAFVPGMILGASLGAKYAIKLGDKWLRLLVLVSIAIMSIRLILK